MQRVAAQGRRILPALPERRLDVTNGRALDGQLDVVPRRRVTARGGHCLRLRVALVVSLVAPAVAQVDAAHVADVALRTAAVAQDDHLLVMGTADTYAHVSQALAAGRLDLF